MVRLHSYEYAQGYTAALQDVLSYFESHSFLEDLKRHKRKQTLKELSKFIRCMIDNRTVLREDPDAFIRCNNEAKNGYELWFGNTKHKSTNDPDWVQERLDYYEKGRNEK